MTPELVLVLSLASLAFAVGWMLFVGSKLSAIERHLRHLPEGTATRAEDRARGARAGRYASAIEDRRKD